MPSFDSQRLVQDYGCRKVAVLRALPNLDSPFGVGSDNSSWLLGLIKVDFEVGLAWKPNLKLPWQNATEEYNISQQVTWLLHRSIEPRCHHDQNLLTTFASKLYHMKGEGKLDTCSLRHHCCSNFSQHLKFKPTVCFSNLMQNHSAPVT